MKLLFLALAAAFLVSCGSSESATDALSKLDSISKSLEDQTSDLVSDKYTSEDGKFKVNFPGTPTVASDNIPTEVGNIEMKSFTYEKSATEVYMIAYSDYPSELVKQSDPDAILTGAKEGALNNMGATMETEEKISMDGHPGYIFKAVKDSYYMVYKIFLKDNRLYQILMMRDGAYPSQEAVDSYIGSFELID